MVGRPRFGQQLLEILFQFMTRHRPTLHLLGPYLLGPCKHQSAHRAVVPPLWPRWPFWPIVAIDRSAPEAHFGFFWCGEIQAHTRRGEDITITDTAIIPLKEPVVDQAYDPLGRLIRTFTGAA